MKNDSLLRPFWQRVFRQAWILNLLLFVALGSLRAYGLFGPVNARTLILLNFLLMWFLPFLFFTRIGRNAAGLRKIDNPRWFLWGALMGMGGAILLFAVGYALYGNSADNWYVSIRNSWAIDASMMQLPRIQLFAIYTTPAILFSPIGEEFFFRGMIHESVREPWGQRAATLVNAIAFSGVHLLHHGLQSHPASGILWFALIMGISWGFTQCRQRSGSLWPAIAAHALFNLVMNVIIFTALM